MDYVIVHELSHLKYKNHSKEFWERFETIMLDYKDAQEWLQQNSRHFVGAFNNRNISKLLGFAPPSGLILHGTAISSWIFA